MSTLHKRADAWWDFMRCYREDRRTSRYITTENKYLADDRYPLVCLAEALTMFSLKVVDGFALHSGRMMRVDSDLWGHLHHALERSGIK